MHFSLVFLKKALYIVKSVIGEEVFNHFQAGMECSQPDYQNEVKPEKDIWPIRPIMPGCL